MTRARRVMERRTFLGVIAGGLLAAPLAAEAQPTAKIPRIGVLGVTAFPPSLEPAFRQGLGQFGYTEGRNVVIDQRHAEGRPERLSQLAADLVRLNVDVIFARGAGALSAAKQATRLIPTVAVDLESDPVAMGFVRNLAKPGGNITGVFLDLPELSGKQLQLVKEVIRPVSRVAILGDPKLNGPQFQATEVAAKALAIEAQLLEVRASGDFRGAFEAARTGRANAVLLLSSPLVFTQRADITALAVERGLPAVSMFVEFAEAGGLMAYGPSLREAFWRAGAYAGRILQGAKPGELPVERPTKFELIVNLKTAKTLGLTIPQSVLGRADQVIE
jgi:putative ABC transport system substrate-binding protein